VQVYRGYKTKYILSLSKEEEEEEEEEEKKKKKRRRRIRPMSSNNSSSQYSSTDVKKPIYDFRSDTVTVPTPAMKVCYCHIRA